ncbi:hypothetical protein C7212DRAFT_156860 [Tuber magnatum]|uniref:Uncharacterized protein n=1 Tax=Tuber magnatum TaxID=42249 RepID=A0A317SZ91_9PEZI|nr:hypothetical protein C7212DRAFT_156860 [Tuber magnatum]
MESTTLKQSSYAPTIRYSIDELLEYRSSLSYVICPIDEFSLVAWAEGLLDKVGDYVPQELAIRKEYAKKVAAMQGKQSQPAIPIAAKRKLEYAGLTFGDFLNLGKYGSPKSSQVESTSDSRSQETRVTLPFVQVEFHVPPKEPGPKDGTSTIGPIQEKDAHSQSTSGKGIKKSSTAGEIVEVSSDGGVQASPRAEVLKPTPSGEAVEEPEESGDIVDQDAWINAMLERTKIFAGNKYKSA